MVDTRDLKSLGLKRLYRFDSGSGHHHLVLSNPKKATKPTQIKALWSFCKVARNWALICALFGTQSVAILICHALFTA